MLLADISSSAAASSHTPILDGNNTSWGQGAIASVVAILIVFAVLLIIIGVTYLIFKGLGYFEMKKQIDAANKPAEVSENAVIPSSFDENDEDMVAAVLVASIDYQNKIKQDVKLVSVKEIK